MRFGEPLRHGIRNCPLPYVGFGFAEVLPEVLIKHAIMGSAGDACFSAGLFG